MLDQDRILRLAGRSGFLLAVAALAACSAHPGASDPEPAPAGVPSSDGLATIALQLTSVPSDVRCLRALVNGYEMVTRSVDVTAGAGSQVVSFPALPVGPSTVFFDAFSVVCASVLPNTGQTWVAVAPTMVELFSNEVTKISIDLRRPGTLEGSVDFVDGTKGVNFVPSHFEVTALVGETRGISAFLHNGSTMPFSIPRAAMTGDTDDFRLQFDCADIGGSLVPGGGCDYQLSFAPKTRGKKQVILKVGAAYVILTGTGFDSQVVRFEPGVVDFGSLQVSAQKTFTLVLHNGSDLPLATADRGTDAGEFALVETTCRDQLAPGDSCSIVVRFAPQSLGQKTGRAWVGVVQASLGGTGIGTGDVSFRPDLVDLGNILLGTTVPFTIRLQNITPNPFPVTLNLDRPNHLRIDSSTCPAMLAAGAVCDVHLSARPTDATGIRANISAGPGSVPTEITATVQVPRLTFSPPSHDFGSVLVGQSLHQIFTVTTDVAIPLNTTPPFGFTIAGGTCGTALSAGASCTIDVGFSPQSVGLLAGELSVGEFFPTAKLSGSGSAGVTLSPIANNFGNVTVGQSADAVFTVSNGGTVGFSPSLAFAGPNANELQRVGGNCPAIVAPGTACGIIVRFTPLAAGPRSATLSVGSSVNTSALSGTGVAGIATVTPPLLDFGPVTVGQSLSRTFTVTNNTGAIISTSVGFSPAGDFHVDTSMGTCPGTLTSGNACTIAVRFAPASAGTKSTTLTVGASAASTSLSGTGVAVATPISNLVVNDTTTGADGIANNTQWSVQSNFQQGVTPFGDRTVTVSVVGNPALAGKAWIRTAADSKSFTGTPVATFTLNGDTLFLLVDNRHNNATTGKPVFLDATFSDTGLDATILEGTTARPYSIWKKSVVSGSTVSLPTVSSAVAPFYFVVVQ
jgi:hypothetical protein